MFNDDDESVNDEILLIPVLTKAEVEEYVLVMVLVIMLGFDDMLEEKMLDNVGVAVLRLELIEEEEIVLREALLLLCEVLRLVLSTDELDVDDDAMALELLEVLEMDEVLLDALDCVDSAVVDEELDDDVPSATELVVLPRLDEELKIVPIDDVEVIDEMLELIEELIILLELVAEIVEKLVKLLDEVGTELMMLDKLARIDELGALEVL